MTNILIEQIKDSWCDEGHKSGDLVKIKINDKDFQLCSEHLDRILTDHLGDVLKFRGLPVIYYTFEHNDRGEFDEEELEVESVGVDISRHSGKPAFNVKNYPELQKVIDLIEGHEAVCLIYDDIMNGKYDSMGKTERKRVSSKDIIDFLESKDDIKTPFKHYLSDREYKRKKSRHTEVDEDDEDDE